METILLKVQDNEIVYTPSFVFDNGDIGQLGFDFTGANVEGFEKYAVLRLEDGTALEYPLGFDNTVRIPIRSEFSRSEIIEITPIAKKYEAGVPIMRTFGIFTLDTQQIIGAGTAFDVGSMEFLEQTKQNIIYLLERFEESYRKDEIYTKIETNNLLDDKADKVDVYTKVESDTLLDGKANKSHEHDSRDIFVEPGSNIYGYHGDLPGLIEAYVQSLEVQVYTKDEIIAILADYYTKLDVYDKTEVDNLFLDYIQNDDFIQAIDDLNNALNDYVKSNDLVSTLGNYYNKTEVDGLLENIDLDDYYKKSEVYTKVEVDSIVDNIELIDYYTKYYINDNFFTKNETLHEISKASGGISIKYGLGSSTEYGPYFGTLNIAEWEIYLSDFTTQSALSDDVTHLISIAAPLNHPNRIPTQEEMDAWELLDDEEKPVQFILVETDEQIVYASFSDLNEYIFARGNQDEQFYHELKLLNVGTSDIIYNSYNLHSDTQDSSILITPNQLVDFSDVNYKVSDPFSSPTISIATDGPQTAAFYLYKIGPYIPKTSLPELMVDDSRFPSEFMDSVGFKYGEDSGDAEDYTWFVSPSNLDYHFNVFKWDLGDDFYYKSEIDSMLDDISSGNLDLSNYYTKAQVDNLIADIDGLDLSDYYTKNEIIDNYFTRTQSDNRFAPLSHTHSSSTITHIIEGVTLSISEVLDSLIDSMSGFDVVLQDKVSISDVYLKTQTYSKTEVDALVTGGVDLSDYYDKTQSDNRFASKTHGHEAEEITYNNYPLDEELDLMKTQYGNMMSDLDFLLTSKADKVHTHTTEDITHEDSGITTPLDVWFDDMVSFVIGLDEGKADKSSVYTKSEIDNMIGDIETALQGVIDGD